MFEIVDPTRMPRGLTSRSFNAENPQGRKGVAAQSASRLGVGRKGSPATDLRPGEELVLADVEGPGVIRHIWITCAAMTETDPFVYRNLVLEMTWDDAEEPSVIAPLGDFFCCGGAVSSRVDSLPIVVAPNSGFNSFIAMPFRSRARIVVRSEHPDTVRGFFYQVDATTGDELGEDTGYFHAQWRRSNGDLARGQDHVVLDGVRGRGMYLGTFFSLTSLERFWWGEGELKFFVDGDDRWPSLTSTGLEDYVGGSWAFQDGLQKNPEPVPQTYSSHSLGFTRVATKESTKFSNYERAMPPQFDMYRWHLVDPIHFASDLRITQQMIGDWDGGLFERCDDLATVAYWYQDRPVGVGGYIGSRQERRPR
ncbi:glycoside hydrolase family 172 protein [Brachybacterium hainanense]|uniref:Glycoside hydrolase family 172 protein n=1 Tax=Brachybacterium hainanense TaxID=1541174 RepID=A0ABV6R8V4_9MICO